MLHGEAGCVVGAYTRVLHSDGRRELHRQLKMDYLSVLRAAARREAVVWGLSIEQIHGVEYAVVTLSMSGDLLKAAVDTSTAQLRMLVAREQCAWSGFDDVFTIHDDFREVEGVATPFLRSKRRAGNAAHEESVRLTSIELDACGPSMPPVVDGFAWTPHELRTAESISAH